MVRENFPPLALAILFGIIRVIGLEDISYVDSRHTFDGNSNTQATATLSANSNINQNVASEGTYLVKLDSYLPWMLLLPADFVIDDHGQRFDPSAPTQAWLGAASTGSSLSEAFQRSRLTQIFSS